MNTKPRIVMVPIERLLPASYNPPSRSDTSLPKNRELLKSLLQHGLIYPILVAPRGDMYDVRDGHRRLSMALVLGWQEIACIVVDMDAEDLYAEANVRSPLTQNDLLHVYLKKPKAVPPRQRTRLARLEAAVGRDTLKALKRWGGTAATYTQARSVARYVGEDPDGPFAKTALEWLMANNQTKAARQAIDNAVPPAQLRRAVADNRPLTLRMTAE
jgi:hypothetical protein